nr:MAG TPA: protein of unknown function DUF859 [Caudoviricetes sp.]
MATSGSFRTTSYEGRSLTFSWNRTSSNIANNTSTIAWSVTGSGDSGYVTCGDIDIVINGTTVYNSAPSDRVDVWLGGVVASGTTTISHNADGSKSFSASINAAIYNYAQNCSGSGTWALDTIPRASNIDKVANTSGTTISTLNTGNDVRVYFTPKSTAFKYRVTVSMNGNSVQNNASGVSVSSTSQQYYQVNIPHTWLSNKESGTLACKLETLNGTSVIGTDNWSISMVVPASVVPTIGAVSSAPVNSNATINGWNIYVANYSKARITCSASGNSGSTISRFQISGDTTVTVNGTSLSYDINLTSSGTKTFTVKAIDSRGRSTGNKSITINVTSYSTPTIQSFNVVRCDSNGNINAEGTSAKLSFVGYYSAIGNNTATVNFAYKLASASTFSSLTNSATGSGGSVNGNIISSTFAIANDYDLKIILKDSLGNAVERTVRLASVTRTLNVAKYGNGVAVGKMSTVSTNGAAGKFECGWDASFDKSVSIDGILNANKNIYMGGLKGQTSGLSIVFSNPDSSENPHNSYIYGGNPAAQTAIGCWDNKNGRNIWSYNDSSNTFAIGSSDATISIKGAALSDFVVQQGTSGNWYYRKWANGMAQCWRKVNFQGSTTMSDLTINLPFTFASNDYLVQLTPSINGSIVNRYYVGDKTANEGRTTTSLKIAHQTNDASYSVLYFIYVTGIWK